METKKEEEKLQSHYNLIYFRSLNPFYAGYCVNNILFVESPCAWYHLISIVWKWKVAGLNRRQMIGEASSGEQ
jgi:hypothetical protein